MVRTDARVENLLDALVEDLHASTPRDPFVELDVVIQSRGMQRWLSHRLAERIAPDGRGVCANIRFPFPNRLLADIVEACGVDVARVEAWQPRALTWALSDLLVALDDDMLATVTAGIGDEIASGVVGRRTRRLARTIADVFDRYVLYRPNMTAAWTRGDDVDAEGRVLDERDRWQPLVWRSLTRQFGDPTEVLTATTALLRDHRQRFAKLPPRVFVFGLSTLPVRHLELFDALATRIDVTLYVPSVSPERWRTLSGAADERRARHPLLASCGRLGDDAARLLASRVATPDGDVAGDTPQRVAPVGDGTSGATPLLAHLQRGVHDDVLADTRVPADATVQIHRCHGTTRQAEVVRDVILGLLDDDPTLEPRDVLVLAPDVTAIAPLVEAAFATDGHRPGLAVRVADRRAARSDQFRDACLALVRLAASRVSATDVLDLLAHPPIAARFGLGRDDHGRIASWVTHTGIRWGIDADDRARHGQPHDRAHTWSAGLDRLLLGVAMADEDDRVVGDVTPFDHVEGDDVALTGRFVDACRTIFAAVDGLRAPRGLSAWASDISDALGRVLATEPSAQWRLDELLSLLDELGAATSSAPVDLRGVLDALDELLDVPQGAIGYETGAVTLCELVPMRSIPHRVVCLVGMDDRAFPRSVGRLGIDLVERGLRVGDRDRRDEDRHLFLEALQAARDVLVVAYTGRDPHTNELTPPAVPVAELLDVLDHLVTPGESGSGRDEVTFDHPLHPFSPRAFTDRGDGRPFSFDRALLPAARASATTTAAVRFVDEPLEPAPVAAVVSLVELCAAVAHPTRHLLEQRLRLRLTERDSHVEEREPLDVEALDRYLLGTTLIERGISRDPSTLARWMTARTASGTVPAGAPGRVVLRELAAEAALIDQMLLASLRERGFGGLVDAVAEDVVGGSASTVDIDVDLGGRRLVGRLTGLRSGNRDTLRIERRFRRERPRQLLETWIAHLALAAAGHTDAVTVVALRPQRERPTEILFAPLHADEQGTGSADEAQARARSVLAGLLELHDRAGSEPLLLFERASYAYAFADSRAFERAAHAFVETSGRSGAGGQDLDAYIMQMYGPEATLTEILATDDDRQRFTELARGVWDPVREHLEATTRWLDARKGT